MPDPDPVEELRATHYNARLSYVREHNRELRVIRVVPDHPAQGYSAGQYTTLALGYWEPRADDASEELSDRQGVRLVWRAYSVSSSMIDSSAELMPVDPAELEFYIVKVPPSLEEVPALTPRLFTKGEGDRIHIGRGFRGNYTLEGVRPTDHVVLLATGTGEAPHNAMTAELLSRGHEGNIVSVVTVRYRADLAYAEQHEMVHDRWPNYRYLAITTREAEDIARKVYIQDLLESGHLDDLLGASLDPSTTHVFLCGNPKMIGLPEWTDDGMVFPETRGVCEILHNRGFEIDEGARRGQVHYEEYWRER